jgi:hypothetical protein
MVSWGFCLFLGWMLFVVAIGIAFLVWAWKQGDLQVAHTAEGRKPKASEPDAMPQEVRINHNGGPAISSV